MKERRGGGKERKKGGRKVGKEGKDGGMEGRKEVKPEEGCAKRRREGCRYEGWIEGSKGGGKEVRKGPKRMRRQARYNHSPSIKDPFRQRIIPHHQGYAFPLLRNTSSHDGVSEVDPCSAMTQRFPPASGSWPLVARPALFLRRRR